MIKTKTLNFHILVSDVFCLLPTYPLLSMNDIDYFETSLAYNVFSCMRLVKTFVFGMELPLVALLTYGSLHTSLSKLMLNPFIRYSEFLPKV